jgi:eukaryotic-like serine/threonine-protein kinase
MASSLPDTRPAHEPGVVHLPTYTRRVDIAVQDALIGRLVDGRYRIRSRIARGGMATVYEAADERLGRDVALKVMHPDLAEDHAFVARFIAEARSAAALSRHRTIVTVFDQGTSDGIVWLALELVRGGTLRRLMAERGRLDPRTALAIMEPVLTALAAAHDAGIVHRDVKPENVLLGDDGHVQVADFGLAHAVATAPTATRGLSTRGLLLGTVAYISPEQALGEQATQRSDVYAAGVMLFELLTGHPPYAGATDYVVVRQHVEQDVPPPSAEVPGIPPEVDALVAAATARNPALRFSDAGAFLGAVHRTQRALDHAPARTTGPVAAVAAAAGVLVDSPDAEQTVRHTNPIGHSTTSLEPVVPGHQAEEHTPVSVPAPSAPGAPAVTDQPDDPYQVPPPRPRKRRWGRRLLLLLVLVGALATAGWWWMDGRMVAAPNVVGMTVEDAEQAAQRAGLEVERAGRAFSETIPSGAVVSSDPSAGARIAPGEALAIVVSRGPERYEVPDLAGVSLDEAEQSLADLTLAVGEVRERFSERVPQGGIISQDPAAGTQVKPETPVSVVVSKGRQPIEVPDVVGAPADEAVAAIEAARLVAQVGEAYSDDVERGEVISQEPAGGTLFRGDPVSLVVSLGPQIVEVPDVEGEDAADALAELQEAGLVARRIELLPAGPNQVLRQAPAGGQTVRVGSEVTIYVF